MSIDNYSISLIHRTMLSHQTITHIILIVE